MAAVRLGTRRDAATPSTGTVDPAACCSPFAGEVLTDEQARVTASLFDALADPQRVRIVNLLATRGEALCVCELTESLGLGQPTVSHHLKRLRAAGLLERAQHGRWASYSLREDVAACLAAVVAPAPDGAATSRPTGAGQR